MMLIVSMFDQAWRPFFLTHAKDPHAKLLFARVFTYFTAFSLWILLGLIFLMPDIIQSHIFGNFHLIAPQYWAGLSVIPPVLLGYFFYGLYINFMVGPVITKRTRVLMWITLLGALTSITANLTLVPRFGILGAGWAVACSYFVMACALWRFTQKNYTVPYQYKRLAVLGVLALGIVGISHIMGNILICKLILLGIYPALAAAAILGKREKTI